MDKFSEVEIKVDATELDPHKFMAFVVSQTDVVPEKVRIISGTDTFYRRGDDVIRHRCDGGTREEQEHFLTVKKRKSQDSLMDRKEIDLVLKAHGKEPILVEAFFELTGWQKEFQLHKNYVVLNVEGIGYKACIAMYDVWGGRRNPQDVKRFLEVEIERESSCTTEEAKAHLHDWLGRIKKDLLPNAIPLNLSLYEYFSKEQ